MKDNRKPGGVGVLPHIDVPVTSPASPSPSVTGSDVDSIPDPINGDVCVLAPRLSPVGCSADTSLESSEKETNNLVEEIYVDKESIARGLKQELKKSEYIDSGTLESISKENKNSSLRPERDKPRGTFVEKVVVNVDGNVYPEECTEFDVVVAVDIGTTYSGYAFAYSKNPNDKQIHMMRQTEGGDRGLNNQKVPSILLLTDDEKFHSFGFTARDSYHDLDQEEATKWLYFDKFKMNLHNNMEVCRDSVIRAQNGRNVPALLVFSRSLCYLKGLIERELGDHGNSLEIRWVVTVPAVWTQQAKQFVREAAYMAGISSPVCPEQLLIVLEPEAASACCRNIHFNQIIKSSSKESISKPGTYMVVDCGGGTIDITIHSLASKTGSLRELHKASGGAFGSLGIDDEFCHLLDDVFGASFMRRFKSERPAAYNELMLSFESRKRSATPYKTNSFNIFPPFAFIDFYRKITGAEVESAVQKYNKASDLSWSNEGILKIHPALMDKLFQPTLDKIIEHVRAILTSRNEDEIGHLFLVGGFAESQVLQKAIKDNFSKHLQIVIPQALSLCVLKGGVLFGLDPLMVTSRKVTHSYGLGVVKPFLNGIHPQDKLVVRGGQRWCADVFERIVESGQSVPIGEVVSRKYTPASTKQKEIVLHVYSTLSRTVQFITDPEVKRCGTLRLQLTRDKETPLREITFSLIFGATDVTAFVMDSSSGQSVEQIVSDSHY